MNYLITSAGKGSRFLKKGIKPPKPLIKVFGNELLIWSLNSFDFSKKDKLFIVTLKSHKVKKRLEKKIRNLYSEIKIFWLELDEVPNGQLLTAMKAISYFRISGQIIIHNCDTFHRLNIKEIQILMEDDIFGIIPCFRGEGDHWSFVRNSNDNSSNAVEVREKERISENCSVGTYIFSSTKNLTLIYEEYLKSKSKDSNQEYFIAPIYQYAIEKKLKVKITEAQSTKTYGTPSELTKSFGISFNELLGENAWDAHQIKTLIVDIDKTICHKEDKDEYSNAIPDNKVCNALRKADEEGIYIILFTSRNMRSFKGTIGLINKITAPVLLKWLNDMKIPFDEIYFGKPWGNSVKYIDDKSLSIENLIKQYSD